MNYYYLDYLVTLDEKYFDKIFQRELFKSEYFKKFTMNPSNTSNQTIKESHSNTTNLLQSY